MSKFWFQSTPPCGGESGEGESTSWLGVVSIHTPVRGECSANEAFPNMKGSIHTPVREWDMSAKAQRYGSIHTPCG